MRNIFLVRVIFVFVLIASANLYSQYDPNFKLQINAGGPELTHEGEVFIADQYSVGGKTYTNNNAEVPTLYKTERSASPPTFEYNIPVENGEYKITLHFAEIYFGATGGGAGGTGKRVFDVTLENVLILDDYDLNVDVGPQTVVTKTYNITITDGSIDMYFSALSADGGTNQPKLSALEVEGISADNQPPTTPAFSSNTTTETTVDLSWSNATDIFGVTGYKIYKDGLLEATLENENTYLVTELSPDTTYNFTVSAFDAAGNESSQSIILSVTTLATTGGGVGGTSSGNWTLAGSNLYHNTANIAIGTNTVPTGHKLAVNGSIITTEVLVQLKADWPDYVFKENYKLPTLKEVAKHIKENGHLINIPSAQEVVANGIELGEMNKLLLEKIEELTLYILEQQEQINTLNAKVETKILNKK